ncbi:MAG: MarR family transcriptional regulator [Ilumatobacteraceae bacterium]
MWIRLLRTTRLAEAQLRDFLRVEHESTLPRFDVMAALHRSDSELTMTELSRMLLVSNGNATAVVDRLVKAGLVVRRASESDRRIVKVALTGEGRRHFADLATGHEARVDDLFADVTSADLDALDAILHRLDPRQRVTDGRDD